MKNKMEIPMLKLNKWHWVEEEGYPKDDCMWCILMLKSDDGSLDVFAGGYNEHTQEFYANFGFGGAVIEAESVVGWVPFEECEWEV